MCISRRISNFNVRYSHFFISLSFTETKFKLCILLCIQNFRVILYLYTAFLPQLMYRRVNVIDTLVLHARMFIYRASRLLSCNLHPTNVPQQKPWSVTPKWKTVYIYLVVAVSIYVSATCRATAREFGLIVISRIPTYVSKSYDRDRSMRYSAIEIQGIRTCVRSKKPFCKWKKKMVIKKLIAEYWRDK